MCVCVYTRIQYTVYTHVDTYIHTYTLSVLRVHTTTQKSSFVLSRAGLIFFCDLAFQAASHRMRPGAGWGGVRWGDQAGTRRGYASSSPSPSRHEPGSVRFFSSALGGAGLLLFSHLLGRTSGGFERARRGVALLIPPRKKKLGLGLCGQLGAVKSSRCVRR